MTSETSSAATPERFTIRRKVFKIVGASFHIYNSDGLLVGFCSQKAFRLKEDLRIYTDESRSEELFRIQTPNVIDFSAIYHVLLPTGERIGSFKRHGGKSLIRDSWSVLNQDGQKIADVTEDSTLAAVMRRMHDFFAMMMPQKYMLTAPDGRLVAQYRTHFNPIVHRISVSVFHEDDTYDDLLFLAGGCLLSAIESRQSS